MATGEHWSREEVEACVAAYLQMLAMDLNGQTFNKTQRIDALAAVLDGRNKSSIEYKFRNISAVMNELGWPAVRGYRKLENYQGILLDVVESQVVGNQLLHLAVQSAVERPAVPVPVDDPMAAWVPVPTPAGDIREAPPGYAPRFSAARRDYLAQEGRNRSLGEAGEKFVVELEARRLFAAGKKRLSERVEHVVATQGDGLGFDVLSFEDDGRERMIEVKTTAFGELTPFFVSRNELVRSRADSGHFHLYRLFDFRDKPRLFNLPGAIESHCRLDAVSYLAHLSR